MHHFSVGVSNLFFFSYKNQETPVVQGVLFLVEKRSPERDWTVAPVHVGCVLISVLFCKFCILFSLIFQFLILFFSFCKFL
jgi:hypothetical protein